MSPATRDGIQRLFHRYIRSRNLRAGRGLTREAVWEKGVSEELEFWRGWFASQGAEWPDDYKSRLDPETPLQSEVARELELLGSRSVRVLDVGAGPLTILGKVWPEHDLSITAVDALGDRYAELYREFGITPPVATVSCHAERLSEQFGEGVFDAAFAQNTLDHSYDPVTAIEQMLRVVRENGIVVLRHFANEAERELYSGLHQWNFDESGGDCVVWRPDRRISLREHLGSRAEVRCRNDDGVIAAVLQRRP